MGYRFTSTALVALMLGVATPVIAQSTAAARTFSIGAGPLGRSLPVFAQQSGLQILYPSALVTGRQARALTGDYTPEAALAELLRGTGLSYRQSHPTVFVLVDPSARAELEPEATQLEEVVVTGTYLRGAESPSPVTVITQDDVARQGRATVAETLAALPQNFTGAAYEGSAGTGADRTSRNSAYATGVNLRGLRADATLVLVNGRRIAGTGSAGDFSDISNLPSSAIARADVLLDGASALYGPDVAEEVMTNCGVEIVFAPKELKIAQELSDRLGAYTTEGRSRSRPTGLSPGRRSTTVSDQRRALMLPQELMQLRQTALIVLKAGLPPIRGRKIAYFRERVFQRRLRPAPDLAPVATPAPPPALEEDPMDFDVIARAFAAEGLPPPPPGADEDAVGAWLDRVVDTAVLEREP
ncbi:type IV secretory system conjugative DNA transfer family protein [Brevundimonas sp. GCM10030266]|uniref:type IV secretory system conjugative DNA transfer family protein n=1 Tax=Brevundimonas sp. GCM10030266 TaxID=3273386 RepID=UPI0036170868